MEKRRRVKDDKSGVDQKKKGEKLSVGGKMYFIVSYVILNTADTVTDLITGYQLLACGEFHWGLLLLLLPFWPGLSSAITFTWAIVKRQLEVKRGLCYIAKYIFFPFLQLWRNVIYAGRILRDVEVEATKRDAVTLKLMEAVMEACPALCIQLSIGFVSHTSVELKPILRYFSTAFSFLSISAAILANFEQELRSRGLSAAAFGWKKGLIFILFLLILLPRLLLWALFVLYLEEWTYLLCIVLVVCNTLVSASIEKKTDWNFDKFMTSLFDGTANLFVPLLPDSMVGTYLMTAAVFTVPITLLLLPSDLFYNTVISEFELLHFHPPRMTCFNVDNPDLFNVHSCIVSKARVCEDGEDPNYYLRLVLIPIALMQYMGILFIFLIKKITKDAERNLKSNFRLRNDIELR